MAQKHLSDGDFEITWQEPPLTGLGWAMSVAPATDDAKARLLRATGIHGSQVLAETPTREAGIDGAKAFIATL
jgi:hypothetical protein